ncbi:MAG: hypothetical protein LBE09_07430 [Christensenellaceae bacterium]|jgi:hypothetical protein|nr:hypothetical protein [Christensenellaceae bacterium]
MKDPYDKRFDGVYKIRMVTITLFLIAWTCVLVFWLRAFEKWDKATITKVEHTQDQGVDIVTYMVDEIEYTRKLSGKRKDYYGFIVGDSIDYLVSNPYRAMDKRAFPLTIFLISEIIFISLLIGLTVFEFRKEGKKCYDYMIDH